MRRGPHNPMAVSRHTISFTGPFVLAAEVVEPVRHYTAAEFAAEFERGRREGARQADTGARCRMDFFLASARQRR